MHEYSLAQDLVARAVLAAAEPRAERIRSLTISVGPSQHLDWEVLRFNLRAVAAGTLVEGAEFYLISGAGGGVILESIELEEV